MLAFNSTRLYAQPQVQVIGFLVLCELFGLIIQLKGASG